MKRNHYLYLTLNGKGDFYTHITPHITLDDDHDWCVGLLDVEMSPPLREPYVVCGDICEASHVGDKILSSLRRICPPRIRSNATKQQISFIVPHYVNLIRKLLDMVNVYILDDKGGRISLPESTLRCTLHIRQNNPWF